MIRSLGNVIKGNVGNVVLDLEKFIINSVSTKQGHLM